MTMKSNKVGVASQRYCKICEKYISYKNYSHHLKTKKHSNNLLKNNDKNNDENNENNDKNKKLSNEVREPKVRFTKRKTKIGADRTSSATHGGDIRDSSLKLLPNPSWQKYPGEKHLKNYNYCGPGTRLDIRLDENNNPKPGEEPINKIDEACLKHDISYKEATDLKDKHVADVNLIHDLNSIKDLIWNEKLARTLIKI